MNICLIPGFMLDEDLWSDVSPALGRLGQLIHVDTARDNSIDAMASRALRAMMGPAIVVGFSMGGYIARHMAYQAPQMVHGLALIASSSRASVPLSLAPVSQNIFVQLSRGAVLRSLHPAHRDAMRIARVQRMSRRLGGEVFIRQSRLRRDDDTARLHEIACPTLVIAAAQDELRTAEESRALHDNIPHSTMEVIANSGHLIPLERPAELIAAFETAFGHLWPTSSGCNA